MSEREVVHGDNLLLLGEGQSSSIGRVVRLPGGVTWVGSERLGVPAGTVVSGTWREPRGSSDAVAQGRLHGRAGMEGSEHLNRGDSGAGQLGRDVLSDTGQPQHVDL